MARAVQSLAGVARKKKEPHSSRKVRYEVVGLGWFAQVAILPAFAHASRNSELVALFSNDRKKLERLGKKYRVERPDGAAVARRAVHRGGAATAPGGSPSVSRARMLRERPG